MRKKDLRAWILELRDRSAIGSSKIRDPRSKILPAQHEQGFLLATLMAFLPLLLIMSTVVITVSLQAHQSSVNQQYIRQAQLASTAAMDFAKEQFELDVTYTSTPETVLYSTTQFTVTYEVVHKGYSNPTNTQSDIQGVGRVYKNPFTLGSSTPLYTREIQGKITYSAGSGSSARFIFIVDNSGSMDVNEWLDSKTTVDAAINYVINNTTSAEVAVVQYGTNHYSQEHKYDVTVQFTRDPVTATTWDRRYGPGSSAYWDLQDHLPGSLADMRQDSVYGPGDLLDLTNATDIQFVLFTDAVGENDTWCCSSLKKIATEPAGWHDNNGGGYSLLEGYDEYNQLKDGTVFNDDGYPGLTAQFSVLSINMSGNTPAISAAIASPGGDWTGAVDANPGDPEGSGIIPRRFISTTLAAGPTEILDLLQEIIDEEINF